MKISKEEIRDLVEDRIYARGVNYYKSGRVQIIEIEHDHFKAFVSGTEDYLVEVEADEDGDWYFAECNCPYWADCKHIVAALLTAKDYYDKAGEYPQKPGDQNSWQHYFTQIQPEPAGLHSESRRWRLLYVLKKDLTNWNLSPQRALIKKDGSLGVFKHIANYESAEDKFAQTSNDKMVMSFLNNWRSSYLYGFHYYDNLHSFRCGEKVGAVFSLLRQSLCFLQKKDGTTRPLKFAEQKAQIQFRMQKDNDQTKLFPFLLFNESESPFNEDYFVLSSDPVWILKEDLLIEITGMNNAACLIPFTRSEYDVTIPKEDMPQFLSLVTSQLDLFENLQLPEGAKTNTTDEITEKRLYLNELEDSVIVNLRFCYGPVEVDLHDSRRALWGTGEKANSFVKVVRNFEEEAAALQLLQSTNVKMTSDGRILTRKNKTLEWLMTEIPPLTARGFVIFGEENLNRFKVNRSTAQVRVSVESGIDWFDLNVEIDFDGILLSLKELKKALKQKSPYVKLADGSTAHLPKSWLDRFRHVMNLSEEEKDRLKLSSFHVTLIDELFAEASQKNFDKRFYHKLQQLKTFENIQPMPTPDTLKGELRPYQKSGFEWLYFLKDFQFGGCLADDMGLGKTVQALTILLACYQNGAKQPSLIVAPTSVIFNWLDEIQRFAPSLRVYNQTGSDRERTTKNYQDYEIILTSYGTLRRDIFFLKDVQFHYVILDESQYIKNPLSQTAKAVKLLKSQHRLALTGTPVENTTIELWSLFSFLNPGLLGNLNYFKGAFAKPIEKNRDQNTAELLRKIVFPFLLRRTKDEVEKDLPPKVENVIYCEMSPQQEKIYKQWRDYYRAALLKQIEDVGLDKSRMNVLEGLTKLRQIACHPLLVEKEFPSKVGKYDTLIEYVEEILAEDHKMLVFSQFVRMLTIIRKYLDSARIPYEYLDGKTRDRKSCVERFQTDKTCKIFLISLRAGGTGLNLTAADYVIHYDPWWNPAVEAQATDRTHRIGQDKHVFVYKMIAKDTVEEKIMQLQERKKELVSSIITTDAGLFKQLTAEDIEVLFS
ncbi:MAG: SNF2-related protein [bacterium]